jgi:hypothetical protein
MYRSRHALMLILVFIVHLNGQGSLSFISSDVGLADSDKI